MYIQVVKQPIYNNQFCQNLLAFGNVSRHADVIFIDL